MAPRGKTSVNWFFGFNDRGEIRNITITHRDNIETIIDQLKNISQIEHSRHCSVVNAMVNIISGLIAHCYQAKKPFLHREQALQNFA